MLWDWTFGLRELCGGHNFGSTAIRRLFDCLSNVTETTVTQPVSGRHVDLFIYSGRSAAAGRPYEHMVGRRMVVVR